MFCFWFFSWISFPPAPEYFIKTVSNFFENSRRYSQLKLCHRCQRQRWQMEKIFNQKNFKNFVWSPLGSIGNIHINFCLQIHLFCRRCRWYRLQFATGVVETSGKFAAGNVDTGGKFATVVNNTRGTGGKICRRLILVANLLPVSLIPAAICHRCRWTLTCEYLLEFSKKFEMILMLLSGAWGKVINEKNLKQKISWHCPFNVRISKKANKCVCLRLRSKSKATTKNDEINYDKLQ